VDREPLSTHIRDVQHAPWWILRLDSFGALIVGLALLPLSDVLSQLYQWQPRTLQLLAPVHLSYGAYSGFLALRAKRRALSRSALDVLIAGNLCWGGVCVLMTLVASGTWFAKAHLGIEGTYVASLGVAEWYWLRTRTPEKT
jgi:hypothetical protein